MSITNVSYSTQVVYGHQSSATNKSAAQRNAGETEQVQGERQKTVNPVAQETAAGRPNNGQGSRSAAPSLPDIVQQTAAARPDIGRPHIDQEADKAMGVAIYDALLGVLNIIQGAGSQVPGGSNIGQGPSSEAPNRPNIGQGANNDVFAALADILARVENIAQGSGSVRPNGPNNAYGPNNGASGNNGDHLDQKLAQIQKEFGISADQAKTLLDAASLLSSFKPIGMSGVGNSQNNGAMDFSSMLPEDMRALLSNINASGSKKSSFIDVLA